MKASMVRTLVMAMFAIGMPVSVQASDWKEYEIVCEQYDLAKLGQHVEEYMKLGWQPLGGPMRLPHDHYCQAMVKE